MKKRIIIILIVLVTVLSTALLYQTFATDSSTLSESSDVYNISLYNGSTIVVPANGTKTVLYKINSPNFGKVSYGVGYTTSSSYIKVKEYYDTIDPMTGVIDYRENKFVKLKLINSGNSDASVTLNTVLGYEFGGDLIPSSNVTLVTEKVKEYDTLMSVTSSQTATSTFLRSSLKREEIDSITFKENNAVPDNVTSVDVSKDSDGSIIMYYGDANSNGRYDVYIGSETGKIKLESGYYLFSYLQYVESLDLSIFNTSSVTNMDLMFRYAGYNATTFTLYGLDNWDTSSVTNMEAMFQYAGYNATTFTLEGLDNWDTSSVTEMTSMFSYTGQRATTWTIGDLSGWDTSSVTRMVSMFGHAGYYATTWTIGDLSNWDTSSVTNMSGMFYNAGYNATTWTIGDLSGWDTSSVTNMGSMFYNAGYKASGWKLNLRSWNVNKVTNHSNFNTNVTTKVTPPIWVS